MTGRPGQTPYRSSLDAFVTSPDRRVWGHVLASEAFGDQTLAFEIDEDCVRPEIMPVPEGTNMQARFWADKDDHSKGTFERSVTLVRYTAQGHMEPVEFEGSDGDHVQWKNTADWSNFKQFVF